MFGEVKQGPVASSTQGAPNAGNNPACCCSFYLVWLNSNHNSRHAALDRCAGPGGRLPGARPISAADPPAPALIGHVETRQAARNRRRGTAARLPASPPLPPPPPAAHSAAHTHPQALQVVRAQVPEATDYRTRGSMLYTGLIGGGAACNDSWVVACAAAGPWTVRTAGSTFLKMEGPSDGFAKYKGKLIDCPDPNSVPISSGGGDLSATGAFPGGCSPRLLAGQGCPLAVRLHKHLSTASPYPMTCSG